MQYSPVPCTGRTAALKRLYSGFYTHTTANPYARGQEYSMYHSGDRVVTLDFLRSWAENNRVGSIRLRRSMAEAAELDGAEAVIYDENLFAGQLWLPHHTAEEQKEYDELVRIYSKGYLDLFAHDVRRDHIALDFDTLLRRGLDSILEEIGKRERAVDLSGMDMSDLSPLKTLEFYRCLRIELEALRRLRDRYIAKAEALAAEAGGQRRQELLRMASALRRVPFKPARSFFEAVQSVHFFLSNLFGLYPLGRPDRYLYPYYKADIENGAVTPEEAQEWIDELCLGLSSRVFPRAASGFIVGGTDASGRTVENGLTWQFLTALDHLQTPDPNGALAVGDGTSDEILAYAAEILGRGTTHPAFYNDRVIVESLTEYGCPPEDAVNYIHSTCAEITVAGKSKGHTTAVSLNLPCFLLETAKKAAEDGETTFESLYRVYLQSVSGALRSRMRDYLDQILNGARNGADPMRLCALVSGCVEKGKGLMEGGPEYCFLLPIFVGFATAVDSLFALRRLVFEEKRLTLAQFCAIAENDFKDNEALRQYIRTRLPHYGNDIPEIDAFAAEFAAELKAMAKAPDMPARKYVLPGTFSYVNHATMGERLGATFDGRHAGASLSDGCCPVQGMDVNGPTALINSLTGWDQHGFLGGMVVNLKFSKSTFSEEKRGLLVRLVRVFMERGGLELQVNCVDRATLENALVHPENHGDLLVRIGGYSDYYVRLRPALQREILERTEY